MTKVNERKSFRKKMAKIIVNGVIVGIEEKYFLVEELRNKKSSVFRIWFVGKQYKLRLQIGNKIIVFGEAYTYGESYIAIKASKIWQVD